MLIIEKSGERYEVTFMIQQEMNEKKMLNIKKTTTSVLTTRPWFREGSLQLSPVEIFFLFYLFLLKAQFNVIGQHDVVHNC